MLGHIMDNKSWLSEIKKTEGLNDCELPGEIEFGGTQEEAILTLKGKSVAGNMQSDAAAFEAWSMALLVHGGATRVRVELEDGLARDPDKHTQRFLYRLGRFHELFPVDVNSYAQSAGAFVGTPLLNQPGDSRRSDDEGDRLGTISKDSLTGWEENLEKALEVSPNLKKAFTRESQGGFRIMRQWPVGLFESRVSDNTRVFPGRRSAIDLMGIDGSTLLLFELKKDGNCKAGAVSEIFFYANVMRDALLGRFAFEDEHSPASLAPITAKDVMLCTDIRAIILAPRLHPLIYNDKGAGGPTIIGALNEASHRTWGDKPIHFEAWKLGVDESSVPMDFTFACVVG